MAIATAPTASPFTPVIGADEAAGMAVPLGMVPFIVPFIDTLASAELANRAVVEPNGASTCGKLVLLTMRPFAEKKALL